MRFEPEVFLSYAHIDDHIAWGGVAWVSKFYEALDARIQQLRGESVDIFFDPELQGNEFLRPALAERLKRAGVFTLVLTPRYVKSEWTRRELAQFCAAAANTGGVNIGEKSRIFAVGKTSVPRAERPPELCDLITYDFFQFELDTGLSRELEIGPAFYKKVDDIASHMKDVLDTLEQRATARKPEGARTVYLAGSTVDLQPQYDALRRDLEQKGHTVLPGRALPTVTTELESFVRSQLAECSMSIHLVGGSYAFVPEGNTRCVVEIQNDLALERARSGPFSHLVWIAPGLDVRDSRQLQLLAALRSNPYLREGCDVLEVSVEDLKTAIHNHLNVRAAAVSQKHSPGVTSVYFVYDRQDSDAIGPWVDFFFNQGLEVLRPVFDGDESEIRALHEENLREADGVIVYYGAGRDAWIQATLRGLHRRKADEKAPPLRTVGIVLGPPETPDKALFKTHLAVVVSQMQGFEAASLALLVNSLESG